MTKQTLQTRAKKKWQNCLQKKKCKCINKSKKHDNFISHCTTTIITFENKTKRGQQWK